MQTTRINQIEEEIFLEKNGSYCYFTNLESYYVRACYQHGDILSISKHEQLLSKIRTVQYA